VSTFIKVSPDKICVINNRWFLGKADVHLASWVEISVIFFLLRTNLFYTYFVHTKKKKIRAENVAVFRKKWWFHKISRLYVHSP
jgi:hypothetical protein